MRRAQKPDLLPGEGAETRLWTGGGFPAAGPNRRADPQHRGHARGVVVGADVGQARVGRERARPRSPGDRSGPRRPACGSCRARASSRPRSGCGARPLEGDGQGERDASSGKPAGCAGPVDRLLDLEKRFPAPLEQPGGDRVRRDRGEKAARHVAGAVAPGLAGRLVRVMERAVHDDEPQGAVFSRHDRLGAELGVRRIHAAVEL